MRISDWSSDVCSSDLAITELESIRVTPEHNINHSCETIPTVDGRRSGRKHLNSLHQCERNCAQIELARIRVRSRIPRSSSIYQRSEEHTSELQSLMRISYAVFCLKKKIKNILISDPHTPQPHSIHKR